MVDMNEAMVRIRCVVHAKRQEGSAGNMVVGNQLKGANPAFHEVPEKVLVHVVRLVDGALAWQSRDPQFTD